MEFSTLAINNCLDGFSYCLKIKLYMFACTACLVSDGELAKLFMMSFLLAYALAVSMAHDNCMLVRLHSKTSTCNVFCLAGDC